jgi:tetratricopeptide (TPR) repeat protein
MKKWLLSGLMIVTLPTAPVWAQASDEATLAAVQSFTAGQEAAQKSDWDTAIPALEKALSLNPELYVAHYWLGLACVAKKDSAKAIEHLDVFISKMESEPSQAAMVGHARLNLVAVLLRDKKCAEALPHLRKQVEAKPDEVKPRSDLAQCLLATKDDAGAEAQLVKLMELNPKGAPFFYQAGKMAYQRKDDAAAKQRLDAFVALTPDGPQAGQAYFLLGQIARRANDNAAAKGYFEKYLGTNPAASPQVEGVKQFLESLKAAAPATPAP